jgi:alpha-galactosidase
VRQFASWGFDHLKLDMCSYSDLFLKDDRALEKVQTPAKLFGRLLQEQDRDIVFNLCGFDQPWEWGWQFGAQSWRTAGDIQGIQCERPPGIYEIAMKNARHWRYAQPGRWNDPDSIYMGWIGDPDAAAKRLGRRKPTPLTPNEQYSYMSMWCLMAAPLLFGGEMTRLDDFTLNVLCNAEVIEVNQDPLGRQARVVAQTADTLILAKPTEDGSTAVGLLNLAAAPRTLAVKWQDLAIAGPQMVRDLWRQKDLGIYDETFSAPIRRHGVCMIRLWPKEPASTGRPAALSPAEEKELTSILGGRPPPLTGSRRTTRRRL